MSSLQAGGDNANHAMVVTVGQMGLLHWALEYGLHNGLEAKAHECS